MAVRNWFRSSAPNTSTRSARRPRLAVEALEAREVPAALSVSDVSVREGPAATGVLDPAGAAGVGLSRVRGIAFDRGPADAHFGDLFVTGSDSGSVARFDWATQTYQPFVPSGGGGLGDACGIAVGPDGNVYVSGSGQNTVFRYDGATGAPLPAAGQSGAVYVTANAGGLKTAGGIAFGADGNLYVCSRDSGTRGQILEYQGPASPTPGAFLGSFVNIGTGSAPSNLTFGPDGNLYVSLIDMNDPDGTTYYGQVNVYSRVTGAPVGTGVFVPQIEQPRDIVFDATGANMYVIECRAVGANRTDAPGPLGEVLHYQGPNGRSPGAYVENSITSGQGGLMRPVSMVGDAAGNLYVSDRDSVNVTRFAPSSQAAFTVTLDAAAAGPVSVSYATADGTAAAGTDYTATSGTLTFAPGVTSQTVSVPVTTVAAGGPTRAFTLNLSSASGATIADGQGVGSILNRVTKFFVADSGSYPKTYQYGSGGTSEEITSQLVTGDTAPRGVATTAAGTTEWVVDANKTVYVYTNHGVPLGSWTAGGLSSSAALTGITTNGTDVWLVDGCSDKVYKYAGAAGRLSGSQTPAGSFSLNRSDANPQDLVTDGTSFWVVDGTALKVFKYTMSGGLLGSWTLDPADKHPTGMTLNPSNVSDLWVVDNVTLKVYQYAAAAGRTSGSQTAAATFALNSYDTNPQGLADPPPPGDAVAVRTAGQPEPGVAFEPTGRAASPLVVGTDAGSAAGRVALRVPGAADDAPKPSRIAGPVTPQSRSLTPRSHDELVFLAVSVDAAPATAGRVPTRHAG